MEQSTLGHEHLERKVKVLHHHINTRKKSKQPTANYFTGKYFFFQPNSSVKIKYATYFTLKNSSVSFDTPKFGRKVGFSKIEGHILLRKTNYPLSKAIPQTLPVLRQS